MSWPVGRLPLAVARTVIDLLQPYASYILPGTFVGFLIAAAVAVTLSDRFHARTVFVAGVFLALLLFNFVAPTAPYPFVSWAHFAEPTEEVETYREFRIVDESGHELKMHGRMTLAFEGVSMNSLRRSMLTEYDEERNEAVARYLLVRAQAYRDRVGERGLVYRLRYPNHGLTSGWTEAELEKYEAFVGIRIYEMTFVTSADGTEILDYEEELVFESFPLDGRTSVPSQPSAMPTREMNRTVLAAGTNRTGRGAGG